MPWALGLKYKSEMMLKRIQVLQDKGLSIEDATDLAALQSWKERGVALAKAEQTRMDGYLKRLEELERN